MARIAGNAHQYTPWIASILTFHAFTLQVILSTSPTPLPLPRPSPLPRTRFLRCALHMGWNTITPVWSATGGAALGAAEPTGPAAAAGRLLRHCTTGVSQEAPPFCCLSYLHTGR